jgi:hypothetical protein
MADALAHTFRSDPTLSFSPIVSTLLRLSNPIQQAGLSQLVGAIVLAGRCEALRGAAITIAIQPVARRT